MPELHVDMLQVLSSSGNMKEVGTPDDEIALLYTAAIFLRKRPIAHNCNGLYTAVQQRVT